jgi:hypothetical protein
MYSFPLVEVADVGYAAEAVVFPLDPVAQLQTGGASASIKSTHR